LKANWGLAKGGLFPESKNGFVQRFPVDNALLPKQELLKGGLNLERAVGRFNEFFKALNAVEQVVLKPDDGIQGRSVYFVKSAEDFEEIWRKHAKGNGDWLLQEYIGGMEAAVFYMQDTTAMHGRIVSMTWKHGFEVTGDGQSDLASLISKAPSDEATRKRVLKFNHMRLNDVPEAEKTVDLIPVRNHHLGATFQDISEWITPEMEAALCPTLDVIKGYNYGRLDIRAPDLEHLFAGKDIKILEANALYSEPVHAYDPRYGLWDAYRIFIWHWHKAFRIGLAHSR
jgi:hypothetical protein